MKKILLFFSICFCAANIYAQDSLRYHYVILDVDRFNNIASAEYNNGFSEDLWKKLHLTQKISRNELLFRCFEYLNDNGYDLVSGNHYNGVVLPENTTEYIFKKKKK